MANKVFHEYCEDCRYLDPDTLTPCEICNRVCCEHVPIVCPGPFDCSPDDYCLDCGNCNKCYTLQNHFLEHICPKCKFCPYCGEIATSEDGHSCTHEYCSENKDVGRQVLGCYCPYCLIEDYSTVINYDCLPRSYRIGGYEYDTTKYLLDIVHDLKVVGLTDFNEGRDKYVPTWWREDQEFEDFIDDDKRTNLYRCYSDSYDLADFRSRM